jgi:hypothetical protein
MIIIHNHIQQGMANAIPPPYQYSMVLAFYQKTSGTDSKKLSRAILGSVLKNKF